MSQPRIIHITVAPEQAYVYLTGQARYMIAHGLDLQVVSAPGELLDRLAAQEGVPVHRVGIQRRIAPLRDVQAIVAIWAKLRRLHPDVVHAHTPKGGLLGMIASRLAEVPVRIYHIHGLPAATATGINGLLLRLSERVSCGLANRVLCVSSGVRDLVVACGFCPADKVAVPGCGSINGVDAVGCFNPDRIEADAVIAQRARLGIPVDSPVVGFVGRIVRDKGLVELAGAWQHLRTAFPDLHLLIVGPFEAHDPLPRNVLAALTGDARVHLPGAIYDLPTLYACMDVFVLPSYREGLPVVALEAAAMRLPVVTTRIAGCTEAVEDGIGGTLVPPRDGLGLADALYRYLADPDLRRRHGEAGRAMVLRAFRQEPLWEALRAEYLGLLAQQGEPVYEC